MYQVCCRPGDCSTAEPRLVTVLQTAAALLARLLRWRSPVSAHRGVEVLEFLDETTTTAPAFLTQSQVVGEIGGQMDGRQ